MNSIKNENRKIYRLLITSALIAFAIPSQSLGQEESPTTPLYSNLVITKLDMKNRNPKYKGPELPLPILNTSQMGFVNRFPVKYSCAADVFLWEPELRPLSKIISSDPEAFKIIVQKYLPYEDFAPTWIRGDICTFNADSNLKEYILSNKRLPDNMFDYCDSSEYKFKNPSVLYEVRIQARREMEGSYKIATRGWLSLVLGIKQNNRYGQLYTTQNVWMQLDLYGTDVKNQTTFRKPITDSIRNNGLTCDELR